MVDIKRVLEMRAKKASERGMERAHIVSRDTCQLIYNAADRLGIR